ncbi:hypothetical protein G7Y79_00048g084170 [Physcia stellaris]|nr:hypothetical protein G7Y79_00048g084170 [Physcia stellaris]
MATLNIERLPTEIQTIVLRYMPSTQALYNLIRASPRYYHVFAASKTSILSDLIKTVIHMDALPDALVASSEARVPPLGLATNRVKDFLGDLIDCREDGADTWLNIQQELKLSVTKSGRLLKLENSVRYHIKRFAGSGLPNLMICSKSISPKITAASITALPLSKNEENRLQRAFYRLDAYCYLFHSSEGLNDREHKQIPSKQQEENFLSYLPPWEVEELASVWHYIRSQLEQLFNALEDKFVKTAFGLESEDAWAGEDREALFREAYYDSKKYYPSHESVNISAMDDFFAGGAHDFFRNQAKRYSHEKHIEYLASMGLSFLHQLFEAGPKQQLRIVLQNTCKRSEVKFLTHALNVYSNKAAQRHTEWPREDYYCDLSLSQPNTGFKWALKTLSPSFPCRHKGGIRSLGYVFWDARRLKGIMGAKGEIS